MSGSGFARRRLPVLALAVCLLAAAPLRAAEQAGGDAATLIDRVLAAYGGKAALAKVVSYRMEGTQTSAMRGTGPFVRTFARPDRLRVFLDYPNHPETRILDGAKGWRSDGKGGILPSEGFLLDSMAVQAARANLPWILDERRETAKLLPPEHGGRLQGIEIALGPGLALTAHVDVATARIVRATSALDVPGMKTGFATDYADFRSVGGVLFAFREGNVASGQTTGDTVITSITLNPALADTDFRP